jgi:hypothetical protein
MLRGVAGLPHGTTYGAREVAFLLTKVWVPIGGRKEGGRGWWHLGPPIGRWRWCWVVQLVRERERGWQGDMAAERREKRERGWQDDMAAEKRVDQSGGSLRLWSNWQIFGIKKDPPKIYKF